MRQVDMIFNSMMGKGETEPYIDCDYLESDGKGQYIDTGIRPNQDTDIEVDYLYVSPRVQIYVFGTENTWLKNCYMTIFYNGSLRGAFGNSNKVLGDGTSTGHAMTFAKQGSAITATDIDTGRTFSDTISSATYAPDYNLVLFGVMYSGGLITNGGVRLGRIKIKQNGVLVRDFRPKIRVADGVAGMYDAVNDTFELSPNGRLFNYGYFT